MLYTRIKNKNHQLFILTSIFSAFGQNKKKKRFTYFRDFFLGGGGMFPFDAIPSKYCSWMKIFP